jgi:hypothetical protein
MKTPLFTTTLLVVACLQSMFVLAQDPAAQAAPGAKPAGPPAAQVLGPDAKPTSSPSVIQMYQKGSSIFGEFNATNYSQQYLVAISINRGIGFNFIYGGMYVNDDWVLTFRKVDDKLHISRRNVRFKGTPGSPEGAAVLNAYTDSVLFSLPIITQGPKGGDLVDLTPVFLGDFAQVAQSLPGFSPSPQKSSIEFIKGYKNNVEIRINAVYASGGGQQIDTIADSRGVTVGIHYSIAVLPQSSYQPRIADDRVGYFMTVVKDFNYKGDRDNFVRYINRWHLEKADPASAVSPPKKPIRFFLDKTIPYAYRRPIREAIEEWNKAYEKVGFLNAVEVDEQREEETWDPEDINYNTFRWITSNAGFAIGPSHVNPYTGQILDADILFDADFIQSWQGDIESSNPHSAVNQATDALLGGASPDQEGTLRRMMTRRDGGECMLGSTMAAEMLLGATVLQQPAADPAAAKALFDKLVFQGLKEVAMHEVGHTLGLRHNFKASKIYSIKEMNDPAVGKPNGIVASVMDYTPTNIATKDMPQGDFYMQSVGAYDYWAIEYGYKPLNGGTQGEIAELKKIASRSGEKELQYATDEDTTGSSPDPDSNRFDMGSDPIEFALHRAKITEEQLPSLVDRLVKDGDDYAAVRRAFQNLITLQTRAMGFAARQVGGVKTSRSHKGDKDGKPPFSLVDAKLQRDVLTMVEEKVLSDKPYSLPPETWNMLGTLHWSHWGQEPPARRDFGIHDFVLSQQMQIVGSLLSPSSLSRLLDAELKASPDVDVVTTAEVIQRLTKSIFAELDSVRGGDFTNRKPAISSLRRNLQRAYFERLSDLALRRSGAPADCQSIAYLELTSLAARVDATLKSPAKLDSYTLAHLTELQSRIKKVLEASMTLSGGAGGGPVFLR